MQTAIVFDCEFLCVAGSPQRLAALDRFSDGARFWSWGKDELNLVATGCYVAGIPAPSPAHRFDNCVKLVIAAGMPLEDIGRTRSSSLAGYFGVKHPPLQEHDALSDAMSVAYALRHLLRTRKLLPDAFA